jgi:hypothetical protein
MSRITVRFADQDPDLEGFSIQQNGKAHSNELKRGLFRLETVKVGYVDNALTHLKPDQLQACRNLLSKSIELQSQKKSGEKCAELCLRTSSSKKCRTKIYYVEEAKSSKKFSVKVCL